MEEVIVLIKELNIPQLICMGIMFWYMTKGIRDDIKEIKQDIKIMDKRLNDLDNRLCKLEGMMAVLLWKPNHKDVA